MQTLQHDWTRIDNDVNGNPRYVIHYLNLVPDLAHINPWEMDKYAVAVKRANKIGGRKYHTKSYGGGIVFQSYELRCEEKAIEELIALEAHPLQEENKQATQLEKDNAHLVMLAERLRKETATAKNRCNELREKLALVVDLLHLDQSPTHDGLANCDALANARQAIAKVETR